MSSRPDPTAHRRRARQLTVDSLAGPSAGIASRRQLYAAGLTRGEVRAELRAGRWRRTGRQTVAVHNGPVDQRAREWTAVLEAGPRACLDGASSLVVAGLRGFEIDLIRVSVPRGARVLRVPGVDVRQTRRWNADDLVTTGIPRTRNEVAAVRAALWARSDRQAALLLSMAVQQRLATPEQLGLAMLAVRRDKRRAFVHGVLLDLLDGVQSLGELDFARECRRRGLPEPTRQAVRRTARGTCYLDVVWEEWGVVVEIDGAHHQWASVVVPDALRHNDIALRGALVLRLPLLGLRVAPDDFFRQVVDALVSRGCPLRP